MKKKYTEPVEKDEIDMLAEQLDPREMYIIGFLKGFSRKNLKE